MAIKKGREIRKYMYYFYMDNNGILTMELTQ